MIILGINAHHADASAAVVIDGRLLAAAEEERFRRVKHWAGFPLHSIEYCLREARVALNDVDHVAVNRDPNANLLKKALFAVSRRPSFEAIRRRLENAARVRDIASEIAEAFGIDRGALKPKVHNIEHHRAHLASAFFVSPFEESAVLSVDGFGDFCSAMWGSGRADRMDVAGEVTFPHSLGMFYTAITQYLGFPHYGDEYKVMGLAPYGKPVLMSAMRDVVRVKEDGRYELGLDYFVHHTEGLQMIWEAGTPVIGKVYTTLLEDLLGPSRNPDDPIDDRHKNVAASMQAMYEEAFFALANRLYEKASTKRLCLAGGCGYNSVANGLIFERTPFRELYIQAAAGDAGGAIGAAYYVWNQILGRPRGFVMDHANWGPEYDDASIDGAVQARVADIENGRCRMERVLDERELCRRTAESIARGNVVGWFQGRMEWGPRALGNRSIVCDPRRADMKNILNLKIKRRESFRPFAPSILREAVGEWFETDYDVPFMLQVYQIREERRQQIPAVTHVNGSGRLQSVTEAQNERYYHLIEAFRDLTGVPIVLNTSFNENEPVVNNPEQALDCFLRTKMDLLVMGNLMIERV
ncbi:MAG TPA: carbamoyltransferase C-terminal domain-containing protein [Thermoanaerobaculia bacterium]|nr:carbamoyltransferase C-terminal domain-containing protein [Thermoanaerobaculia bacterium]